MLTLAKMANTGFTSRRHGRQRGAVNRQQDFATLMSQSVEIRYLLPTMLSGLLQTPAYVHSNVNHPLSTLSAEERAKLVAAKLARQSVLDERGKRFVFVLTESAVRCQVASRTDMAVQVDHLESLDRRPAVDIEVIPIDTHLPNAPINIFAVYDERLVTVETEAGTLRAIADDFRRIP